MRRLFDLFAVFACGACVMMLEIIGFRLFAPYFGYSVYVTGSMISAIMLAMSVGYLIGGWLIDKRESGALLFVSVLAGAVGVLVILGIGDTVLVKLGRWGLIQGTLGGALLLFGLPMVLISMMSPGMIRLLAKAEQVGTTAGQIAALSTLGSIAGTLAASFYLLPTHGVRASLWITFATLMCVAIPGLWLHAGKRGGVVATVALLLASSSWFWLKPPVHPMAQLKNHKVLWDVHSPYSRITVVHDREQDVRMVMPSHFFVQSVKHYRGGGWTRSELDVYNLGGVLAAPTKRILLLGVGAGAAYQLLQRSFPDASLIGVDIDARMLEAGKRFFGLVPGQSGRFVVSDARRYVTFDKTRHDLIAINLFAGGLYIPFYLATVEFFSLLKKRLQPNGWILMNVVEPSGTLFLSRHLAATMKRALPHVYLLSVNRGNVILMGSRKELSLKVLREVLAKPRWSTLKPVLTPYLKSIFTYDKSSGGSALTDDRSRLESLTFRASQHKP